MTLVSRATLLLLLAFGILTTSADCPCNYPPTRYKNTPPSEWVSRFPFNCSDTTGNGDVVCACNCCSDGLLNGLETDIDCGGPCGPCSAGKACATPSDCLTGVCLAGACSESLYYFGGNQHWPNYRMMVNSVSQITQVGSTLAVTAAPVLPASLDDLSRFLAAGVINGVVYVINSVDSNWGTLVFSWSPGGSWATQSFEGVRYELSDAASVTVGNKIYILGGSCGDCPSVRWFNGSAFLSGSSTLPAAKLRGFAVAYNNQIWFAGGTLYWAAEATVWSWDLDPSHAWVTTHPGLAVPLLSSSSAVLNGKWCAFGGTTTGSVDAFVSTVQCWNFDDAGSWTTSPKTLPMSTYLSSAVAWLNRFYLLGILPAGHDSIDAIWSWSGSDSDDWVVESAHLPVAVSTGAVAIF